MTLQPKASKLWLNIRPSPLPPQERKLMKAIRQPIPQTLTPLQIVNPASRPTQRPRAWSAGPPGEASVWTLDLVLDGLGLGALGLEGVGFGRGVSPSFGGLGTERFGGVMVSGIDSARTSVFGLRCLKQGLGRLGFRGRREQGTCGEGDIHPLASNRVQMQPLLIPVPCAFFCMRRTETPIEDAIILTRFRQKARQFEAEVAHVRQDHPSPCA